MLLSFLFINSYQLTRAKIQSQSDQKDLDTLIQRHCELSSDWFQMNNSSSSKNKEDKKFVQVSPDTVGHLAESVGIANLSPAVARALAEDVSYRCRELASVSSL